MFFAKRSRRTCGLLPSPCTPALFHLVGIRFYRSILPGHRPVLHSTHDVETATLETRAVALDRRHRKPCQRPRRPSRRRSLVAPPGRPASAFAVKIPAFLAIGLSLVGSVTAENVLQRGIRFHVWPDSLLVAPRRLLSHPALVVITTLLMAGTLLLFVILPFSGPLGTLLLALPLSLSRARFSLDPPSADPLSTIPRSALYPASPLHSDQWGN